MEIRCYLDSGYSYRGAAKAKTVAWKPFSLLSDFQTPARSLRASARSLLDALRASRKAIALTGAAAVCVTVGWLAGYGIFILHNAAPRLAPVKASAPFSYEIEALDAAMAQFALVSDAEAEAGADGAIPGAAKGTIPYTQPVTFKTYTVKTGDSVSGISKRFGLSNVSTLISVNAIENARLLRAGQVLEIPSIDGIYYTVKAGDSVMGISAKNNIPVEDILDVNDLDSTVIAVGSRLFLPGVPLDPGTLRKHLGELFIMPLSVSWRLSSPFGSRHDPFTGALSHHTGIDMAVPAGTPIYAAMGGKVAVASYSNVFGNYVIINHGNGYQTLYGHMQKTLAQKGQSVSQGAKIGLVGSTGYSTGPHLHFTVYKNGRQIDPMSVLKR
jgi:murein DD-endopeptidase MepM/ murein hydrolase activator NlpD